MIIARSFSNKTVAVMGLARSGKAAVESLVLGGARVLAWDDDPKMREEISGVGVEIRDLHDINFKDLEFI